jgi:hypothetical protein
MIHEAELNYEASWAIFRWGCVDRNAIVLNEHVSAANSTQTCILWNKTKVRSFHIFSASITRQFSTAAEDPELNSTFYKFGSCRT